MNQRRALIGCMVGILVFTVLSWISQTTWDTLEAQSLEGRSALRFFSPFNEPNFTLLEFDQDSMFNFSDKTLREQKAYILDLVTELAAREVQSINILVSKNNIMNMEDYDLETSLGDFETAAQVISFNDIETVVDNDGKTKWLDRKQHNLDVYPVIDLIEDAMPPELFTGKDIILISPNLDTEPEKLNLLINYLDNRWVGYLGMNDIVKFILTVASGVMLAAFVYWARIISFFAVCVITVAVGQVSFSAFNVHIETLPFLANLISILLMSNLFDLNLMAVNRKEIFKAQQERNQEIDHNTLVMSAPFINENRITKPGAESTAKFFLELENNFEDLTLAFQEKTVKSVNSVQDKISELMSSTSLPDKDGIKVSLLKHNFDNLIEEFDAILFNLVPFRFEGEQGLINILELFASKIFLLTKGKVQIGIDTEFPSLKFSDLNQKVNVYRILQRLIDLIKESNEENLAAGLNIAINIFSDPHNKERLRIRISYEGKPIELENRNFKIKEIKTRAEVLEDAEIDFGEAALTDIAQHLTNHIELSLRKPLGVSAGDLAQHKAASTEEEVELV